MIPSPTLPPSLVRFEAELEEAVDRRRHRTRRAATRSVLVAGLAVVILAITAVGPGTDPRPASAVERAAAVLAAATASAADGSILHLVEATTTVRPDGSANTTRTETWQQTAAPWDWRRVVVQPANGGHREMGRTDGRPVVWNPLTDTVHTLAPDQVVAAPTGPDRDLDDRLVDGMRALLASGNAHEDGRPTVNGRPAIRITSDLDDRTLVVDAQTYQPLEWSLTGDDGTRITTRIESLEPLPDTAANRALTSVRAQHPSAAVDATGTVSNEPAGAPKR